VMKFDLYDSARLREVRSPLLPILTERINQRNENISNNYECSRI
jgi:hypothetical protein